MMSSPVRGGGPCEAWWRGTLDWAHPLEVTLIGLCPSTIACGDGPPPPSEEDWPC
jgi:hypothetical protein